MTLPRSSPPAKTVPSDGTTTYANLKTFVLYFNKPVQAVTPLGNEPAKEITVAGTTSEIIAVDNSRYTIGRVDINGNAAKISFFVNVGHGVPWELEVEQG